MEAMDAHLIPKADPTTPVAVAKTMAAAKRYVVALLIEGPVARDDKAKFRPIRDAHIRHMHWLRAQGKLPVHIIALGQRIPVTCIFACETVEEVQAILAQDPMVQAGYLVPEIYPGCGLPGDKLP